MIDLPAYAEAVTAEDGSERVRCIVCGAVANDLAGLDHDCIYRNDLVADGGETACQECGEVNWEDTGGRFPGVVCGECGWRPRKSRRDELRNAGVVDG